jgi:hypothetical protein
VRYVAIGDGGSASVSNGGYVLPISGCLVQVGEL